MKDTEYYLLWFIRIGLGALLLTPFVVTGSLFFPFITGKNFFFRIVTELIFGAWVVLALEFPAYRPRKSPLLFAFLCFVGAISLSTFFGVDPAQSFWSSLERMEGLVTHIHLLALFLVVAHTVRERNEWSWLAHGFLAVSVITSLHAFLQYTGTLEIVGAYRPYGTFGNSIYLAGYLIFSLFIAGLFFLKEEQMARRVVYALIMLFEFFVFFVAASRGAFIGFSVGALVTFLGLAFVGRRVAYRWAAGAVASLLLAILLLVTLAPKSSIVQNVELFSRLASISFENLSRDPRIMIWGVGIDAFQEKPLLGWGPENFIVSYGRFYNPALYGNEPWFDRTHNMFLEWLVAGGLIGFCTYLLLLGTGAWTIWKLVREKILAASEGVVLGGMFFAYAVQNAFVFDNIISYLAITLLYAFLQSQYTRSSSLTNKKVISTAVITAPFVVGLVALLIYIANIKPLLAANKLNTALQILVSRQPVETVIGAFDQVISYNTFANAEARERLSEAAVQIVNSSTERPSPQALLFLNKAIAELRAQQAAQPYNPKYPLFLAKALVLDAAWNDKSFDEAEATYQSALRLAPNYAQTHMALAEMHVIAGNSAKASQIAKDIFDKAPRSENMFYDALTVMVAAQDVDSALYVIERHTTINNLGPTANFFQGDRISNIVAQSSRISSQKDRSRLLEELARWSKPNLELYLALAQTYTDMGSIERGREYAYKAVELKPELKAQVDTFFKNRTK